MGLFEAFAQMDKNCPFEDAAETLHQTPVTEWDRPADDTNAWLDRYVRFTERPGFNPNYDGYISPYTNSHWGATSDIMQTLTGGVELAPLKDRVDPNRVFTSSIASLRTTAADQIKIVRLFERKLMESLNDKGKFGLNEDDIAAMQALTTARNTLISITKEQIGVQKSIAELKIKQQQQGAAGPNGPQGPGPRAASAFDVGRSIIDNIFEVPMQQQQPTVTGYQEMDVEQASAVLDSVIGDASQLNEGLKYENDKPRTFVMVGDSDADTEYVTLSASGEVLPDYPKPNAKITAIDREAKTATDELLVSYPIIDKPTAVPEAPDVIDV